MHDQKNPKNVREKPFRLNFQKTFVKVCQVACKLIFSLIRLQVPLKLQSSENSFNEKFWSSAPDISQFKLIDEIWFLIQTVWRTFIKALVSLEHFFIEKKLNIPSKLQFDTGQVASAFESTCSAWLFAEPLTHFCPLRKVINIDVVGRVALGLKETAVALTSTAVAAIYFIIILFYLTQSLVWDLEETLRCKLHFCRH